MGVWGAHYELYFCPHQTLVISGTPHYLPISIGDLLELRIVRT